MTRKPQWKRTEGGASSLKDAKRMEGVLLIDKPSGITSAEVVRRIRARVRPARVGHLGTLDPFATGLLPILIGEATKIARFLESNDKRYEGVIKLGEETDTLDPTGKVVRTAPPPDLRRCDLALTAHGFTGPIEQVPPVFSAIKIKGTPLYRLARKGAEVALPAPRRVEIRELDLRQLDDIRLAFMVRCSTGTYVRSLARDIGSALASVAHLTELRRLETSGFGIAQAMKLEAALRLLENGDGSRLIGLRDALSAMPEMEVTESVAVRVRNGDASALAGLIPACHGELFKVICNSRLIAIFRALAPTRSALERVFAG